MLDDAQVAEGLLAHGFVASGLLGEGGYAKVYKVQWVKYPTEIFVAKVTSLPDGCSNSRKNAYQNEIAALKRLYHKNIVKIYEHFEYNKLLVIIMEYCSNGNLKAYVKKHGKLPIETFNKVARDLIDVIAYCHENKIAHRDIKPSNIMLDKDYKIKICDFGISQDLQDKYIKRRDGSLPFLPPEMFDDVPYDPKKADIWSLGITFYYLAIGKLPWVEFRNEELMLQQIVMHRMSYPKDFPGHFLNMINKMTTDSPNRRPSAKSLLVDIQLSFLPPLPRKTLAMPNKITKCISGTDCPSRFTHFTSMHQLTTFYTSGINPIHLSGRRSSYS